MQMTMKELAALAGVSQPTVSLVLNGKADGRISAEKQARVKALLEKYKFQANMTARGLRGGRRHLIGIVMLAPINSFYARMVTLLQRKLGERGYMSLFSFWESADGVAAAYESVRKYDVDGVIAWHCAGFSLPTTIPCVSYYGEPGRGIDTVAFDDRFTMRTVLEQFTGLGHTRIGMVAAGNDRRTDYLKKFLAEQNLPVRQEWFTEITGTESAGRAAFRRIAALRERPGALFILNDCVAAAFISEAKKNGWKVPHDFSVIGYNDLSEGRLIEPALSTFDTREELLTETLIGSLFRRMDQPDAPELHQTLQPSFLQRDSCREFQENRWIRGER